MLYPGSLAGRIFMSVSLDCRVVACAGLVVVLFSSGASASWLVAVVEAVTLFLRGTGAMLGSLGSRAFRVRFGLASVLVAEAPSATTGTFGLRPGFFLAGGADGARSVTVGGLISYSSFVQLYRIAVIKIKIGFVIKESVEC